MGEIIKKTKIHTNRCEMCKVYEVAKPVYIYRPWVYQENLKDLKVCLKCAKREHGEKNKKPLPE